MLQATGFLSTPVSMVASAAIGKYMLVKLNTDGETIATAGLSDTEIRIGFTGNHEAEAAGHAVPVYLLNRGGFIYATADKAIDIGEPVYGAAAGEVSDVSTNAGKIVGYALQTAATGDIFMVAPIAI